MTLRFPHHEAARDCPASVVHGSRGVGDMRPGPFVVVFALLAGCSRGAAASAVESAAGAPAASSWVFVAHAASPRTAITDQVVLASIHSNGCALPVSVCRSRTTRERPHRTDLQCDAHGDWVPAFCRGDGYCGPITADLGQAPVRRAGRAVRALFPDDE